jgi:pimeloyl-ACP methyl ester carboxylesterase
MYKRCVPGWRAIQVMALCLSIHGCVSEVGEEDADVDAPASSVNVATSSLACTGTTTYEAESMFHSTGGATTGGWNLWSNGYLSAQHPFGGATTVRVMARGMLAAGAWPQLTLSVEGRTLGSIAVASAQWTEYSFAVEVGAGAKELRISFTNDFLSGTEDRNLLVDKVVVGCATASGSSTPIHPIAFAKNTPITLESGTKNFAFIPDAYDATHQTPITLFVWLHGCGGFSEGDIWTVSPGGAAQSWISLTVGGAEGRCWNTTQHPAAVLAAIADIKTHFNIDPKRVILGGYSSGGDLTYRTAFQNAGQFAGVLVSNSAPFFGTGASSTTLLNAASWRFPVVHLAHRGDTTYPIALVRSETNAVAAKGHTTTLIERDGSHWDSPNAVVDGQVVPGTSADIATYLFPYLKAGWASP